MFCRAAVLTIRACIGRCKFVSHGVHIMEFAAVVLIGSVVLWIVEEAADRHL